MISSLCPLVPLCLCGPLLRHAAASAGNPAARRPGRAVALFNTVNKSCPVFVFTLVLQLHPKYENRNCLLPHVWW